MSHTLAILNIHEHEMVKRIGSLVTLLVLVLTECFTPMCCVLAENNAEPDFEVEENTIHEEEEESENQEEENMEDSSSNSEEEAQSDDNEKESLQESSDDISEGQEDTEDEEQDAQKSSTDLQDSNIKAEGKNEELPIGIEDNEDNEENNIQDPSTETSEIQTGSEANTGGDSSNQQENVQKNVEDNTQDSGVEDPEIQTGSEEDTGVDTSNRQENGQENNQNNGENNTQDNGEQNSLNTSTQTPKIQTGSEVNTGSDGLNSQDKKEEEENEEGKVETITEEIQEIITNIRYFFKKEGDSRYIKYGRDSNNIGTITLKDPQSSASITIMDKNLGAESVGSNGYYFQWGNNHGVKTVNSSNKTSEKAIYKDSYYSRGYEGQGKFIVGGTDYWEDGAHYNSLWGNESKESTRYGGCPVGYHIPTIKEWNQLLSIWGKIHTQDTSTSEMVLRYSANYATKNIHTFKGAATQCSQGDTECVNEDKLSIIIDTLSSELKLPLAGSYDENGNFHDGLGVYWTSISKDGNKAGVFDMNTYIGNGTDSTLMYKSQGHNIRCFQNIYPYEAPVITEPQNNNSIGTGTNILEESTLLTGDNPNEINNNTESQNDENTQNSYSENDIPSNIDPDSIIQDTTGDLVNKEINIKEYTITWKNEDETIIDTTKVTYGQTPIHDNPIQPADAHYSYKFTGWEPELKVVEGDAEYKAKYIYIPMKYTITWKNEDGTIRDTTQVAYGQIPTHEDITQPADEKYTYTFKGWEPEIKEVTGDAEYRATYTYTLRKYTVTWEDENGKVLKMQQIEYGTMPTYNGEIPTKESTEEFEYIFTGWDKEISEIKGDIEYIAKYDVKEKINENIEDSSTEVSELQTGDIESGSAIDLLEELLVQAETGEVLEYTEEDRELELAQIRNTLNNKKIKGKETYNNITVNVEAPKGIFPEGVELRISPIVGDAENQAIKEQLMENGNVTAESELVSFDISFIYTLSNGEEAEIQPKDGNIVKVSFNYKNNNKFNKGNKEKNKDLKVYHFEKVKNKKNRKTEEIQIKEIKINESESLDGELVIDAEKFSVYSVAAVDTPMLKSVQSNQLDGWTYGVLTFTGSNGTNCVSIMDRNLGAENIGEEGYYYQWGNNYGFTSGWISQHHSSSQVDVREFGPSEYNSDTFITNDSWAIGEKKNQVSTEVQNLWGGYGDTSSNNYGSGATNYSDRQGPCPDGWHVPSVYEVGILIEGMANTMVKDVVPSAGFKYMQNANTSDRQNAKNLLHINYNGGYLTQNGKVNSDYYFWTSTRPYFLSKKHDGYNFIISANIGISNSNYVHIGYAYPVRCFYNSTSCSDIPGTNTGCNLPWGGTTGNGAIVTAYTTASATCPTTCTSVTATCNNGVWSVNNFTGTYTNQTCTTNSSTCDASFTLNSTGANGTYSGCTSYTVNANSCNEGTTKYKLTNCANGYHTENNSTCISNSKQVACAQTGKPANSSYITGNVTVTWQGTWNSGNWSATGSCAWICDPHYHTGANNNSCEIDTFQITWKDGNGSTLKTDTVNYNETPVYARATPTKTATAQYSYTFNNTWSPTIVPATAAATYTAQFNSTVNQYTATIVAEPNGYGTVSQASVKKDYNSDIVVDGNKITIGGTEVTATPTPSDAQYTYTFSGWTNTCGNNGTKLTGDCTIQAQFERTTNKYSIVFKNWDGAVLQSGMVAYGTTPTPPANPTKAGDAQYTYTFDTWSPSISSVTQAQVYTAVYYSTINNYVVNVVSNNTNSGTVTTGSITVPYGIGISTDSNILTVGTQTSTANPNEWTQMYAFFFNDWDTSDCGATVTTGCTITANFSSNLRTYTIQFFPNNSEYGKVNDSIVSSTSTRYGSPIVVNDINGTVTVNSSVVTRATPTPSDDQYTYRFVGWDSDCGDELTHNCTITGNFTRTVNEYDVIFDSNGGDYTPTTQSIEYGSTATRPTPDPTKTGYEFSRWTLNGSDFDFSTPIKGTTNLLAKRNLIEYTITYNLDGGTNNPNNPSTYTIESGTITLESPTRVGYTFLGWTGNNGDTPQTGVVIPTGSHGNKTYNAVWQANTTEYVVYHYVKKVGESSYALSKTDILSGTTDELLILSSLAKESEFMCAHYSSGSLSGTENGPGEIITQTNLKGDGTTKIYLYYTRNSYTVTLSGDEHIQMLKINGNETNQATLECGSNVPVEAVPKPGYHIVRWDRDIEREERENGD